MPHADVHVLGSVRGYTTLAASRGVSERERTELEALGFGGVSREEDVDALRHEPCAMGRLLASGRWAISRLLPGGRDDLGRGTVETVTLLLNPRDWSNSLPDLQRLLAEGELWRRARVSAEPGLSIDGNGVARRVPILGDAASIDALERARESQGVVIVEGQPRRVLSMLHALDPADAMAVTWGLGLFAVPPGAEFCAMRRGANASTPRIVVVPRRDDAAALTAVGARVLADARAERPLARLAAMRDIELELVTPRAAVGVPSSSVRHQLSSSSAPWRRSSRWWWIGVAAVALSVALLMVSVVRRPDQHDREGGGSTPTKPVIATVGDSDSDGVPDEIDPDDDNDGLSDTAERTNGSDPLVPDAPPARTPDAPVDPASSASASPAASTSVDPVEPAEAVSPESPANPIVNAPAPVQPAASQPVASAVPAPDPRSMKGAAPVHSPGDRDGDGVVDSHERSSGRSDADAPDSDHDGYLDGFDALPRDPAEHLDHDGDGQGDNADDDDDGDGLVDEAEQRKGTDPLRSDSDGDQVTDLDDFYASDPSRQVEDTDGDGDTNAAGTDQDIDGDGLIDEKDDDIDGDGVPNASESSDRHGASCATSADADGDGVADRDDAFDDDPREWVDRDGDRAGDRRMDPAPDDPSIPNCFSYADRVARAVDRWRLDDAPQVGSASRRMPRRDTPTDPTERLVLAVSELARQTKHYPWIAGSGVSADAPRDRLRAAVRSDAAATSTVEELQANLLRALETMKALEEAARADAAKPDELARRVATLAIQGGNGVVETDRAALQRLVTELRLIDVQALRDGRPEPPSRRVMKWEVNVVRDELARRAKEAP